MIYFKLQWAIIATSYCLGSNLYKELMNEENQTRLQWD